MDSFTLGTDPELICRINGEFSPAYNYFKSHSSFGLDGSESTAEIRPGYSESPLDLTCKIQQILEYGNNKYPELELYSGHFVDDHPIGGHLHFSVEPEPEIIDSLDTVLGSLSNCIDDRLQKERRERTGYGRKGAYRRKPYGFEYRTPGSFLLSTTTTLVTFTLSKLTIVGVVEDGLNFTQLKERQHSRTFLLNLKHYLHTIPDDCREGLKEMDALVSRKWDWNKNILPHWGLAA